MITFFGNVNGCTKNSTADKMTKVVSTLVASSLYGIAKIQLMLFKLFSLQVNKTKIYSYNDNETLNRRVKPVTNMSNAIDPG
jgi:hypothetical protein